MQDTDEKIEKFLNNLAGLNAGAKARLKRDAGKELAEAHSIGLFFRVLPYGLSASQEEIYFLVATLYPLADNSDAKNFGASLKTLRQSKKRQRKPTESMDKRFEVLLDANKGQLPHRLRQTVKFLKSGEQKIGVNWEQLLKDLLGWQHPSRFVQKQWAREYFALPNPKTEENISVQTIEES
jgi:CRISPR type I-E-associated protein CasB/Cse2